MSQFSLTKDEERSKPFVNGARILINGEIREWTGTCSNVTSPILNENGDRIVIGTIAMMAASDAVEASNAAKAAWNTGRGKWPQMSMKERIESIQNLVENLKAIRSEITKVLMWEICKNVADAGAEFDRTVLFIEATINAIREIDARDGGYKTVSGVQAKVRRAGIGAMLAMGPFNYPFNETYTTLIPALLMGNTVVMKIPTVGGLAHVLTMEAYAKCLPPGVMNFVSGQGRVTMGPVMKTGVDLFAFIGGSNSADTLLKEHPAPHRLKVWLSLEGKNLAIIAPDADVDVAVEQCVLGSLTYNGQRCTAIKMIFVHSDLAESFTTKFIAKVANLKAGLPWSDGVSITPLPEPTRPGYLQSLVEDAVSKGAKVMNSHLGGGRLDGNLFHPAVVAPVTQDMKLWHEEQFGPVVPIAYYSDRKEVEDYIQKMHYGQQAAVFSSDSVSIAHWVDLLSTAVGRININTQCGRSPDVFPFSGRRSSALGTLSVTEALTAFSVETVLACKATPVNGELIKQAEKSSNFLAPYV
mmetsp:Transcript_30384/g.43523  ORF Transcript_30384/g.43523 Transcript_30384/m.43523 type:complete len:526 (-) Transcript_30384:134-1711(-)